MRAWVKVVNVLLLLQGLVILGGAAYVASQSMSSFFYVLAGVGVYVLLVGVVGLRLVSGTGAASSGAVRFYAVLLFLLVALHAALVVGFLAYEDRTIEILRDLNSNGDNTKIRDYLDSHRVEFKWASLGVLAVEFLAFCVAACCASSVFSGSQRSEGDDGSMGIGLLSSPGMLGGDPYAVPVSATPQTDARRAAMAEKYGNERFAGRRSAAEQF